jgi:hypothetical protein
VRALRCLHRSLFDAVQENSSQASQSPAVRTRSSNS